MADVVSRQGLVGAAETAVIVHSDSIGYAEVHEGSPAASSVVKGVGDHNEPPGAAGAIERFAGLRRDLPAPESMEPLVERWTGIKQSADVPLDMSALRRKGLKKS